MKNIPISVMSQNQPKKATSNFACEDPAYGEVVTTPTMNASIYIKVHLWSYCDPPTLSMCGYYAKKFIPHEIECIELQSSQAFNQVFR